jgi:Uri superfamily endonuclease
MVIIKSYIYIGETGRSLETRVNEHKKRLKLSELQEKYINDENISSLLAAHVAENKHNVKWEEVKILGKENH